VKGCAACAANWASKGESCILEPFGFGNAAFFVGKGQALHTERFIYSRGIFHSAKKDPVGCFRLTGHFYFEGVSGKIIGKIN
jgi:hypothetical protein